MKDRVLTFVIRQCVVIHFKSDARKLGNEVEEWEQTYVVVV